MLPFYVPTYKVGETKDIVKQVIEQKPTFISV
jgi:hypothetical protein